MKRSGIILLLLVFLAGVESNSPCIAEQPSQISSGFELGYGEMVLVVRPQTPREAYSYLLRTLDDMDFFRANGYDVALPDHPAFSADSQSERKFETFSSEVYDAADFEQAMESLTANKEVLLAAVKWFDTASDAEGFRKYDRYEVTLTLYGPGGSFDPDTGSIVMLTTPEGKFKGGGGPHTIVHEMMHLAIDEGLVQRFGLTHWEKERLVDLLVQREFSTSLPDYSLQSLGEKALDPYVEDVVIAKIAAALTSYVADSPR